MYAGARTRSQPNLSLQLHAPCFPAENAVTHLNLFASPDVNIRCFGKPRPASCSWENSAYIQHKSVPLMPVQISENHASLKWLINGLYCLSTLAIARSVLSGWQNELTHLALNASPGVIIGYYGTPSPPTESWENSASCQYNFGSVIEEEISDL